MSNNGEAPETMAFTMDTMPTPLLQVMIMKGLSVLEERWGKDIVSILDEMIKDLESEQEEIA